MTEIHEAKPGDAARLAEIVRLSPEAGFWSEDDLRRSIAVAAQPDIASSAAGAIGADNATRQCLVAEEDGRIIGFLLAERPVADETEVLTLAVDPEARRRGVASGLLQSLLASHTGKVFLEVRRSNQAAQQLYQRLGFTVCGLRPGYYRSPVEDALVMRLVSLQ